MIVIPALTPSYTHRIPRPLPTEGGYLLLEFFNMITCTYYYSVAVPFVCGNETDVVLPLDNKPCGYYRLNIWNQFSSSNTSPALADAHFVINLGIQLLCQEC